MLSGGPGEGRRLQHHELSARQHAGERLRSAEQRSQVGLAVPVQRRRDADEDRLGLVQVDGARRELDPIQRRREAAPRRCPRCGSAPGASPRSCSCRRRRRSRPRRPRRRSRPTAGRRSPSPRCRCSCGHRSRWTGFAEAAGARAERRPALLTSPPGNPSALPRSATLRKHAERSLRQDPPDPDHRRRRLHRLAPRRRAARPRRAGRPPRRLLHRPARHDRASAGQSPTSSWSRARRSTPSWSTTSSPRRTRRSTSPPPSACSSSSPRR